MRLVEEQPESGMTDIEAYRRLSAVQSFIDISTILTRNAVELEQDSIYASIFEQRRQEQRLLDQRICAQTAYVSTEFMTLKENGYLAVLDHDELPFPSPLTGFGYIRQLSMYGVFTQITPEMLLPLQSSSQISLRTVNQA